MNMPDDPVVWTVLIVVVGLVVALLIWLGRGLVFRKDKQGYSVELKESTDKQEVDKSGIKVASDAKITNSEVGDIVGYKIEGKGNSTGAEYAEYKEKVDVLSGGKIKGTRTADIAGVKKTEK